MLVKVLDNEDEVGDVLVRSSGGSQRKTYFGGKYILKITSLEKKSFHYKISKRKCDTALAATY
jgi:hypothetical protein